MPPIEISPVRSKRELKQFIKFQYKLYKGNPYFVPPLYRDELETFSRDKNYAFSLSDAELFLARRDGKVVGRIVVIQNNPENQKYNIKNVRFGWFECVEDYKVACKLFETAEKWGKERGMETITGPHGFCDLDPQGLLIEGFDRLATIAGYYHHPYYRDFVEMYGFEKEVDFVEFWSTTPTKEEIPQKLLDVAEWIKKKYDFRLLNYKSIKEYKKRGRELFALLEESFSENFGTVPLSEQQVDYYIEKYISYIHKDLIKIVVNKNDEMVGFLITMPNLSKAFQKAKGRLFPFGIFHLLKGYRSREVLDFYLAGVKKEYRNKGVDLLMVVEIVKTAIEMGFKYAESNQELENNTKVQAEWKFFNPVLHKRRRIYKKLIS